MTTDRPDVGEEVKQDTAVLAQAIGGWKGLVDGTAPTVVFLMVFLITHQSLRPSVAAAVGVGVVLAVARLARRESLQQVLSGFFGLALSAYLAQRTGRSENFFVLGILQNAAYATACLISVVVRRPLLGYIIAALQGKDGSWRNDPRVFRTYSAVTWLWTGVFAFRVAVTAPLYFSHLVTQLGVAKLVLGWPLYVAAVFVTYRVVTAASVSR